MTRITFSNYGVLEHMYSDLPSEEFIEEFWGSFGQSGVPRNSGSIKVISVGNASGVHDTGGFGSGNVA